MSIDIFLQSRKCLAFFRLYKVIQGAKIDRQDHLETIIFQIIVIIKGG